MFTDLSKLSTESELRAKQLKCLMSIDCLYEYVLNVPCLIDLDRLENELLISVSSLINDLYKPINNL